MINIEISGLSELIKQCEKLATPRELEETDKRALKRIETITEAQVKKMMPRSKDVTKSGKKGYRTYEHAADNIPVKITKKEGKLCAVVGWDKRDSTDYFYVNFIEFGTSQMPPIAPFKRTFIKQRKEWDKIFQEEYEKLIEKLGG